MFSTVGHDQHKARRAALNRFFSMVSFRRLQPIAEERVQRLIERFRGFKDADGEVMKIDYAFAAFTNGGVLSFRGTRPGLLLKFWKGFLLINPPDVVMEYSYGRSDHRLEEDDFGPD